RFRNAPAGCRHYNRWSRARRYWWSWTHGASRGKLGTGALPAYPERGRTPRGWSPNAEGLSRNATGSLRERRARGPERFPFFRWFAGLAVGGGAAAIACQWRRNRATPLG